MPRLTSIKEIKQYLKDSVDPVTLKRLRPLVDNTSYRRKDGHFIVLHIPCFINIQVDNKFYIESNNLTYTFKNDRVAVTVWRDKHVTSQVTIYPYAEK